MGNKKDVLINKTIIIINNYLCRNTICIKVAEIRGGRPLKTIYKRRIMYIMYSLLWQHIHNITDFS